MHDMLHKSSFKKGFNYVCFWNFRRNCDWKFRKAPFFGMFLNMDLHSFSECNASIRINSAKNHCAISFDGLSLVGGHGNCGHVAVRCAVHHPLRRFYEGAHVCHYHSLVLSWFKGFNGMIV